MESLSKIWTSNSDQSSGNVSMSTSGGPSSPGTSFSHSNGDRPYPTEEPLSSKIEADSQLVSIEASNEIAREWSSYTFAKLTLANRLESDVNKRVMDNRLHQSTSQLNHVKKAHNVETHLAEQMKTTGSVAKDIDVTIRHLDLAVKKSRDSVLKLQRQHRAKWAPLCVCIKRLEIRDARPDEERTHDAWQIALETERNKLNDSRKDIEERLNLTEDLNPEFEEAKRDLLDDLQRKRHSINVDHRVLLEGKNRAAVSVVELEQARDSMETIQDNPDSPDGTDRGATFANEQQRLCESRSLITKATDLISRSEEYRRENAEAMQLRDRECTRATLLAEQRMQQHIKDLIQSKKPVEARLSEVEKKIYVGELSAKNTDRRFKQQAVPLQALSRQFSMRSMRQKHDGEHIRDSAHDALEDHFNAVKKSVQQLATNVQATDDLVEQLRETKKEIVEALRLKAIAIRIDMSCAKVAPKTAGALFYQNGDNLSPRRQRSGSPTTRASGITHVAVTTRATSPRLSDVARRQSLPAPANVYQALY